ncbi:MAG: endolytic transglycosylase MltG [Gammaproteobacteria bacterium]|nr:endolytic transglycosylase MltG [Gammaproteobacteria bacterium]
MARLRKWLLAGAALVVLALSATAIAGYLAWRTLDSPLDVPGERVLLEVPSGSPLHRVSEELARRDMLEHPRVLTWYAGLTGDARRIHAGEYELRPGMTPRDLLGKLVSGQVYMHQLTVVEGWRYADLRRQLNAHEAVAASGLDDEELMARLGSPGLHPEGQFLPDTYRFPKGTSDVELLRLAHDALRQRLAEAWESRAPDLEVTTPYEALTLASIIEKETALASERRLISGVFHERLRRGMRLQTDPTVIYGLGETFDGDLRRRDLTTDTPYNTYTRRGLPPTPIALPSAASIDAAVEPERSGALYFVATGLPDGSHVFSETLEEHNRAVRRYLDRLRDVSGQ